MHDADQPIDHDDLVDEALDRPEWGATAHCRPCPTWGLFSGG